MSLVNDALRRAREVRPPTHSPLLAQMQFRPVEPVQYSKRRIGVVMPVAAIVVAVVALFFTWRLARVRTASAPRDALASAAANLNRPGSPLTPSDGERVPFRAGEGFGAQCASRRLGECSHRKPHRTHLRSLPTSLNRSPRLRSPKRRLSRGQRHPARQRSQSRKRTPTRRWRNLRRGFSSCRRSSCKPSC